MTRARWYAVGIAACAVAAVAVTIYVRAGYRWDEIKDAEWASWQAQYDATHTGVLNGTAFGSYLADVLDELQVDHTKYRHDTPHTAHRSDVPAESIEAYFRNPAGGYDDDFWLVLPRAVVDSCAGLDATIDSTGSAAAPAIDSIAACAIAAKTVAEEGADVKGRTASAARVGQFWVVRYTPPPAAESDDPFPPPPATIRVLLSERGGAAIICPAPTEVWWGM